MEPAKKDPNNITYIYPPSPSTTRGETSKIDVSPDQTKIAYCSANLVILRNIQDTRICETYSEHLNETTCVRFSPNGVFACSGDIKGNVKIWFAQDPQHPLKKAYDNVLTGKIHDFAWTSDSQRLIICGEGQKMFAKVIIADTGSNVGEITGHSRTLLTCAFSPARPFKLVTGGEDFNVNLYEGPPFKFKCSDIKSHKNFVTCVKINPASDSFVSVSSDKKIIIHDIATAEGKDEITDSPHTGTISACEYIDANTLVTVSMDKTAKIWDLTQKKCTKKLLVNTNATVEHMQQGAALFKDGLCSISFSGVLNFWKDLSTLANDSLPSETVVGHQASVNVLLYSEALDTLVSGDRNGRVITWRQKRGVLPEGKPHVKQLAGAALSASRKAAYVASVEGVLKYLNLETQTFEGEYNANVFVNGIAASKKNEKVCYIAVDKKKILVAEDLNLKKEFNLGFEPLAVESSNDDTRLFVGTKEGTIVVLDAQSGEVRTTITHKPGVKVTTLAVSRNEDKFLVSGDSQKNIVLWSLTDYSKLTEDWVYHSAGIQSLEFSEDNERVVSAANDSSIIVWNTQSLRREIEYRHVHKGSSLRALILSNGTLITSGADNLIKELNGSKDIPDAPQPVVSQQVKAPVVVEEPKKVQEVQKPVESNIPKESVEVQEKKEPQKVEPVKQAANIVEPKKEVQEPIVTKPVQPVVENPVVHKQVVETQKVAEPVEIKENKEIKETQPVKQQVHHKEVEEVKETRETQPVKESVQPKQVVETKPIQHVEERKEIREVKEFQLQQGQTTYVYPPSPSTARGETSVIDISPNLAKIVYCSSNLVIIRDVQEVRACETFNEHLHETTCARFSPNGSFVCSGDAKGNVKVWSAQDPKHPLKKAYDNVLTGKIRDIAWTSDSQRLIICGEGQKMFAKVMIMDTGSNIGEITGHSRTLLTCAFSPSRPLKLITGGEDFNVNLYEGPPFKFKCSDIKSHKNFVTCVRFNPAGDSFVSVSSDKKIIIHDTNTAEAKDEILDSPHVGTVSACEYIDANTLVTVSMDKTVKIWDLEQKKCIKKLQVSKNPTVEHMLQGAALYKDDLCSLSFNGALNFWRGISTLNNDSLPSEVVVGHQASVNVLLYSEPLNAIVSGDRNGRIIIWKSKAGILPEGKPHVKQLAGAALSASRKGAYVASVEGVLKYLNLETQTFEGEYNANVFVNGITASKKNEKVCYIAIDKKKILVTEDLKLKKEINLDFEPLSIESSNDDTRLFVGNKDGVIAVLNAQSGEFITKITHKSGVKVTNLTVSRSEDKFLASGDSQKNIVLWNLADYSKLTEDWVNHSAGIQSLEFSEDNERVVSAANDSSVIVWSTQTLRKEIEHRHVHKGGSFRALILPNSTLATSGADNLIKEFKMN